MTTWKILVVDDSRLNREIIEAFLEDGPYTLEMAHDGDQALNMLAAAAKPYDLVILDRMMPKVDGMLVLQQMKASERFRRIPVIMQTAAAAPKQIQEGLNAGCYFYLTKPFKMEALISIVNSALADLREQRLRADALAHTPPVPVTPEADYPFATVEEARTLAIMLSTLCPDPNIVSMGLTELLLNAVEHGNLGITYAEKSQLKREDRWEEEISNRLAKPEYTDKKAAVSFSRHANRIVFTITDQGNGFDWRQYLEFDPARAFDPNGRGITMAKMMSFNTLEYQGIGNQVVATVLLN